MSLIEDNGAFRIGMQILQRGSPFPGEHLLSYLPSETWEDNAWDLILKHLDNECLFEAQGHQIFMWQNMSTG